MQFARRDTLTNVLRRVCGAIQKSLSVLHFGRCQRAALYAARVCLPAYLERVQGQLQHPSDRKYEIEAWLPLFGHRRRDTIEDHEIEQQVRGWQLKGVAASTVRHRLSALSMLYRELDGKAYNPVVTVERPSEPRPGPNAVPVEHLVKVFDAMRLTPLDLWLDSNPACVCVNKTGKGGKAHWSR